MRILLCCVAALFGVVSAGALTPAPQAGGGGLTISTTDLSPAELQHPYHATLSAVGGITPYHWEVSAGSIAPGIVLASDGSLSGTPSEAGEFHFTVTVTDINEPAHQATHDYTLRVITPLLAEWGKPPKVNGQRIDGTVVVSNSTDHDFDLTMVALAVADNGRATAVGYQRLRVPKGSQGIELPFGGNLPFGNYQLNVDVVAEVAATHSIYRARLVPEQSMQILQGP